MTNYALYKKWWIEHEAPHKIPSLYYGDTPETAFKQHIQDMGLYELMETLENWNEEQVTVQDEPSLTKLLIDAIEKFKKQNPVQPPPFPRPPYDYNPLYPEVNSAKPQCRKCGMQLDKVMGYVCGDVHCPTFMKATC